MFLRVAGRRLLESRRMGYNGTRVEWSWRRVVSGGVRRCSVVFGVGKCGIQWFMRGVLGVGLECVDVREVLRMGLEWGWSVL